MRKEWVVVFTTTVEADNSPKKKKILNIYSVTVQHLIKRGMTCWETDDIRAILKFVVKIVLPQGIGFELLHMLSQ